MLKLSLLILGLLFPLFATANATLSIPNIETTAGAVVTIPVNLQNDISVKGLQFNFYTPEGFEVQGVSKTNRMAENAIVGSMQREGFYAVMVYNVATNICVEEAGNGTILNISVKVPDNAAGPYEMSMRDIIIMMTDGTRYEYAEASATIITPSTQTTLCSSIALDNTSATMNAGETMQLTATVLPDNAANKTVTWTSSDNSVASVSNNGLVTALTAGTATITATTCDGTNLSAACNVTVTAQSSSGDVYFDMPNTETTAGAVVTIPVNLQNDIAVKGFQFSIYAAEDFVVQGVSKAERLAEGASASFVEREGFYAVVVVNTATNISVEEAGYGTVLNITVKVPDNAVGTYNISLRDIIIMMADNSRLELSDVNATITVPGAPTILCSSIALDNTSATMNTGETMQLTATVLPDDAANKTVTWTSSDRSVATVSSNGLVTALTAGTATITATTCDGSNLSATCNVTVTTESSSGNVYFDMPNTETTAGAVVTIPINLQNDIAVKGFQFNIYTPDGFVVQGISKANRLAEGASVGFVDRDGFYAVMVANAATNISVEQAGYGAVLNLTIKVPDNAAGTYNISLNDIMIVMADNSTLVLGDVAATITVPGAPTVLCTSITLDNTSATMNAGETMQLMATVLPEDAANKSVTWTSSDRSVATVSNNGLVTALTAGTATITATTCDGSNLSATCNVTVTAESSSGDVYFDMPNVLATAGSVVTIPVNLQNDIAVKGFQFNIFTPDGFEVQGISKTNRMAEGASVGFADRDGFYAVMVANAATNISVEQAGYGTVLNVTVTIPDNAAGTYNISLSDIIIVMADNSRFVLSDVVATITVPSDPTILCSSISLDNTSVMMNAGETMQLTATVLPEDAANRTVTWTSSDDAIATISDNGLVTALASGTATITATTCDGSNLSASCNVIVMTESVSNRFDIADVTAFHGETVVIPVALINDQNMLAFQTDVFLPEGFTIATDEDDEYMITPADRLTDSHVIMTEAVSNGSVRIICFTPEARPITGNSGDVLFNITVNVPENAAGEYSIILDNSRLTTADYTEMRIPVEEGIINVETFIPGDVNCSGTVNVTDIVVTAQYILEMNPDPFDFDAADMNGDGDITVTDIMIIARLILYPNSVNAPMYAPELSANGDFMSGDGISLRPGETRTVSIALDNMIDYSAFQLNLDLPEGLTASNFNLTNRAASHALDVNTLSNGKTRALCYSPAISAISGHEGALLTFDVTAEGYVEGVINVDGIEMVTTSCHTMKLNAFGIGVNSETAINESAAGKTIASVDYFNVAGQRLDEPMSGVTIIVTTYTDGTFSTAKVMR